MHQTQDMIQYWLHHSKDGINTIANDTRTLALHVFTYAAFGKSQGFRTATEPPQPEFSMTIHEALAMLMRNPVKLVLVANTLLFPVLSRFGRFGRTVRETRRYLMDLFDKERKLDLQKRVGGDNLLSALIRSTGEDSKGGLNDAEVLGNLIIYSIAGHETTAGTLSYSILLLAAYPEWQDWIAEEIHTVLQG